MPIVIDSEREKAMSSQRPCVPEGAALDLFGDRKTVQVNHCRQPSYANFGVPARIEPDRKSVV